MGNLAVTLDPTKWNPSRGSEYPRGEVCYAAQIDRNRKPRQLTGKVCHQLFERRSDHLLVCYDIAGVFGHPLDIADFIGGVERNVADSTFGRANEQTTNRCLHRAEPHRRSAGSCQPVVETLGSSAIGFIGCTPVQPPFNSLAVHSTNCRIFHHNGLVD